MGFDTPAWFPKTTLSTGTSLLLSGPSLTAKRRLMLDLCRGDEGAVLVTTKVGGERLLSEYGDHEVAEQLRIVDCVSAERGFGERPGLFVEHAFTDGDPEQIVCLGAESRELDAKTALSDGSRPDRFDHVKDALIGDVGESEQ